jgi:hypothetical protein
MHQSVGNKGRPKRKALVDKERVLFDENNMVHEDINKIIKATDLRRTMI